MGWPPKVGEVLPRANEALGVRDKLEPYSLNKAHHVGRGKANGFELILGITLASIDYLEAEIHGGALHTPIVTVRPGRGMGRSCVVDLRIQGIGRRADRFARVRTAWMFDDARAAPRLTSAYIKP